MMAEAKYRIAPFFLYMAFIVVADLAKKLGVGDAEIRWLYPIKVGAVTILLWHYWRYYSELRAFRMNIRHLVLSVLVGVLVLILWINLDANWMRIGQSSGFDPRDNGALRWDLVAFRLVGAALVVPLMEELFWRSYLLRWLDESDFLKQSPVKISWRAMITASILFGIEHDLWLAGIVAGLAFGWLYRHTGNIWSSIVAHAVTNGLLGCWIIATGAWFYW